MRTTITGPKLWLVERVLGGEAKLNRPFREVNWLSAIRQYQTAEFEYPKYYQRSFHGLNGGYLVLEAALTYDPITARVLLPDEGLLRQAFAQHVKHQFAKQPSSPARIVELGVGTGSATMYWRKCFPQAEITGLDLSPYMLVAAALKLKEQQVTLRQGFAEATGLSANSFDLVTASYLFHELPANIARQVVGEAYRLLKPGGLLAMVDGNQRSNILVKAVASYFPEPYLKEYLGSDLGEMCHQQGFKQVKVKPYLGLYQHVIAIK
jgi:ubiquinone/menaquinone biosynthesis C-methylase UbiE